MNLLIFVLTFLLVISSISYQALEHFKVNAKVRGVWDLYLHQEEPCIFNLAVRSEYNKMLRSKASVKPISEEEDDPEDAQTGSSSGINFRYLVDSTYLEKSPQETELVEELLNKLIVFLFGDQPFFHDFLKEQPNLLKEWIPALRQANEALGDKKIGSVAKLEKLELGDERLRKFWYAMLRPNPVSIRVAERMSQKNNKENFAGCFQTSLKNYLSQSKVPKLRVFLASRPLLYALLDDENEVNEILLKRRELSREVNRKNNPMSLDEASKDFQNFGMKFSSFTTFEPILDFKVTKTRPSEYE